MCPLVYTDVELLNAESLYVKCILHKLKGNWQVNLWYIIPQPQLVELDKVMCITKRLVRLQHYEASKTWKIENTHTDRNVCF